MNVPRGMVKIDGIGLADLPRIGLYATDTIAAGGHATVSDEPAARELEDGVLIVHGHSDLTELDESMALTFGTRVVAVSNTADLSTLAVSEGDGRRRHIVDALEESHLETGQPLPEEEGHSRLTEESALAIFERLTGIGLGDLAASEFVILRPVQEHDETEERPFIKRLFGLH
ncbi:MAG: hypothetical protein ABR500_14960 [Dermatophilaceae bacterium]|nr:hypothetical protein [Intrasporangiaceae bacterium]